MTSSNIAQEILKALDCILANIKWKGPPSDLTHLDSPVHLAAFKKLGNQELVTSQRIITHALRRAKQTGGVLRVCSIGCEDGTLDQLILKGLKDIKVQYVGLDMDEQVLEGAMEKLSGISSNSLQVKTIAVDYEDQDALKQLALEPFDVIWMVNCTYYATSLRPLIQGVLELLKLSGDMLIISSSKQSLEQLVTRFWSHQRQHDLHTTENVLQVLTQLQLPYVINKEPVAIDITSHIRDNFESAASALVLDHLVFCRISDYPPEVKKLVLEYLQSISEMFETSIRIISMSDLIQVPRS